MGYNPSVVASNSVTTDALWRSVGLAVHNQIAAFGLVQAPDPGQANWATDIRPASTSDFTHFEIWRMDDPLQPTAPVFFRLDYATIAGINTVLNFRVTIGTGTDGAGNITGRTRTFTTTGSATAVAIQMSGDKNCLAILAYSNGSSGCYLLGIERFHNAAGGDIADGVMAIGSSWSSLVNSNMTSTYLVEFSGDQSPASLFATNGSSGQVGHSVDGIPMNATTGTVGNNVHTWPIKALGFTSVSPFLFLTAFFTADIAVGTTPTMQGWDGSSKPWLILGSFGPGGAVAVRGSTDTLRAWNLSFAFRQA